jgi:hypothetical protein
MRFTYPEPIRRLVDLPERDPMALSPWICRPGEARGHDGPRGMSLSS